MFLAGVRLLASADDKTLRYLDAPPAELVAMARKQGLTDDRIIVTLADGIGVYDELRACAEKYAPALGITPGEFLRRARGYRR